MRRAVLVTACLAVLVGISAAGEKTWRDHVRALGEGTPGQRRAAAARLADCREVAALPEILRFVDDADSDTRGHLRRAVRAIAALAEDVQVLAAVLKAPAQARETAALILADEMERGRRSLVSTLLRTEFAEPLGDLLVATGREDATDLLLAVLVEGDVEVRLRVLGPLGSCASQAARVVPWLRARMKDAGEREARELLWAAVRLRCVESRAWLVEEALSHLDRLALVIDPAYRCDVLLALVSRLPKSHDALVRLVGKDLGIFEEDWKKHIARISPPERPRRGSVPEPPAPATETVTAETFFGVPLPEGDFVFLLDASASMNREVDGRTLIEQVKERVRELLGEIPEGRRFNIIFFNVLARSHRRRLVECSTDQVRSARKFVSKMRAEGATNLGAGLRAALRDPDVREIILLSDGRPTRGQVRWPNQVLELIGGRRVRVHTVGTSESERFLKEVARLTGGRYGQL